MSNQIKEANDNIHHWLAAGQKHKSEWRAQGLVHDVAAVIDIWDNFKECIGTTEVLAESSWVPHTKRGNTHAHGRMGALFNKTLNDFRKETGWPTYRSQEGGQVHRWGRVIPVEQVPLFRKLFYKRLHTFKN